MDSLNKNKIYAAISITVIILTAASFFATVSFLLKINNLVFNVDQNIIKEQTTVLNKDGFEKIKTKLNPEKNNITNEEELKNTNAANGSASSVINNGGSIDTLNNAVNSSPAASSVPVAKLTVSPAPTISPSPKATPAPTPRE